MKYTSKLTKEYLSIRKYLTSTDNIVFPLLKNIGIKNKKVLDYGCGDGREGLKLLKMGAKNVTGIDISSSMIKRAKAIYKNKNLKFINYKGKKIPLENNQFDLAFSHFVFHHVRNLHSAFKEINRVLAKGGYLVAIMSIYNVKNPKLLHSEIKVKLQKGNMIVFVPNIIYNKDEIKKALKKVGFRIKVLKNIENQDAKVENQREIVKNTLLFVVQKI